MIAFQLIKMARQTLRHWSQLEHDERERLRADADRVRSLAVELAGPKAKALLRRDAAGVLLPRHHRDPEVVAAELTDALAAFGVQAGGHAHQIAMDSSRTVRWGTRAGRVAARSGRRFRPKVPQGHQLAQAVAGRVAGWVGTEGEAGLGPEAVADYGRHALLGAEVSGIDDAAVASTVAVVSAGLGAGRAEAAAGLDHLTDLAGEGPWEAVGAWKLAAAAGAPPQRERALAEPALRALHEMRVTNLAIHLSGPDTDLYTRLNGQRPPHDGFFGPPVFATDLGPSREDYFDHAILAAAQREPARVSATPGAPPADVAAASAALWDFGRLALQGPLLVSADLRDETAILAPVLAQARACDHTQLADALAAAFATDTGATFSGWTSLGAARVVEEYLSPELAGSPPHCALVDSGLAQLREHRFLGLTVSPDVLSPFEAERLAQAGHGSPDPGG